MTSLQSGVFWRFNEPVRDPRSAYDPFHHRWMSVAEVPRTNPEPLVIFGVTTNSDPSTNNWSFRYIVAGPTNSLTTDSTTIGFNKDWIVVQLVMRSNAVNVQSLLYVFDKTNVYAQGAALADAPTLLVITNQGTNSVTIGGELPALDYDNTGTNFYLLQNANGTNGCLRLFAIHNDTNGQPVLRYNSLTNEADRFVYIQKSGVTWLDHPPGFAYFATQKDVSRTISTGFDSRIQNVVLRNGSLWAVQTVTLTNPLRSAVQWWELNPEARIIRQFGRIQDTLGTNYAFPSIAVNRWNDVLIGFSVFSSNIHPSAGYSFRAYTNFINTMGRPLIYQAGQDVFDIVSEWGDYSLTQVDPVNDADFWTLQEYAETLTFDPVGNWGTAWAKVCVEVPPNDVFSAALALNGTAGSTNGCLFRATREPGEPNHAGDTNTLSVWYSWAVPDAGEVAISVENLSGHLFDTVLAVYTGTNVGALTPVASHAGGADGSYVVFPAASNTVYRVAVAGAGGRMGGFTLSWVRPTTPFFYRQPQATNAVEHESVTFSAVAAGNPQVGYFWRSNNAASSPAGLPGATNATYTYASVLVLTNPPSTILTQFFYSVIASNASGLATSAPALLNVHFSGAARLTGAQVSGNEFTLAVSGVTNRPYVVQASTNFTASNLIDWVSIHTNYVTFNFTNQITTNYPYRYFRAVAQ